MSEEAFARGVAVGLSDVKTDAIVFRFRNKSYRVWTRDCAFEARWNGYFYEMGVKQLRCLRRMRLAQKVVENG